MDHGGMGGGGSGPACKISMLWNWYTVDSCFIARSWHVRSKAMFAGSCIGVILLVMLLELIRRAQREYDRYIVKQIQQAGSRNNSSLSNAQVPLVDSTGDGKRATDGPDVENAVEDPESGDGVHGGGVGGGNQLQLGRQTFVQQVVRAGIYVAQFALAYFIMLLAMYYNGYIIICILIGAFLGHLVFAYDNIIITARLGRRVARSCIG
ncbi:Ctr copper transporter [Peziza echinospora]|nr:Ctr copper transporter [Peziza echinospora]